MINSNVKQKFAFIMAMAMILFLMPREQVFATGGVNMTISGGVLTAYNGGGGAVTIPSDVTSIGPGAFAGKAISSVSIPGSVKSIGDKHGKRRVFRVQRPQLGQHAGVGVFDSGFNLQRMPFPDKHCNFRGYQQHWQRCIFRVQQPGLHVGSVRSYKHR